MEFPLPSRSRATEILEPEMADSVLRPLEELITTYNELNACMVEELDEEPSPLEFMRYVSRNTPFVVRGAASSWQACRLWDANYLTKVMQGTVNVAVTPYG
jgi:peptidyl-lysine (3S)-dioxygenase / protease